MKPFQSKLRVLALAVGSLAISALSANAANSFHAASDLVLTFQNPGGATGSTQTVTVALGNVSTVFRDGGTFTTINIASTLSSTFGPNWFDATTLWVGAAGFRGTSASSTQLLDSDPHQTIYISKARTTVGTEGQANTAISNLGLGTGTGIVNGINAVKGRIEADGTTAIFVEGTSTSFIDDQNPFSSPGVQNAAYTDVAGGVQGNFGAGNLGTNVLGATGTVELALDLYRFQTRSDLADPTGFNQTNVGQFLGTITINQAGDVNFSAVPEPSTYAMFGLAAVVIGFVIKRRRAAQIG